MFQSKKPQGMYLIGAAIVWAAIFIALAIVLSGTVYFAQVLPILSGGAVYFILLVPGGYAWERQKSRPLLPESEKTMLSPKDE
jgi:hypothetical protein